MKVASIRGVELSYVEKGSGTPPPLVQERTFEPGVR
jgi:hypothetical protein